MFLSVVPLILPSGFTSPVDNMPPWLQVVAQADPIKHFLIIVVGLLPKGVGAGDVFSNFWPLVLIAGVTLTGSALFFRAPME